MAQYIFRSHRAEVEKATKSAIDVALRAVGGAAEKNAKLEVTRLVYDAPHSPHYVRTGNLRNSITNDYSPSEQLAYVGSTIEYSPYVEYGTRHMPTRPFLRNACQNYADEYKKIISDTLKTLSK